MLKHVCMTLLKHVCMNMLKHVSTCPKFSKLFKTCLHFSINVNCSEHRTEITSPPQKKKKEIRKKCMKDNTGVGSIIFSVKILRSINCMQCFLPYVQKRKRKKIILKSKCINDIPSLFCFLVGNWKWIHKLFSKYLQYKRSLAEWRILRMEEENNVIYSYVQAGDQNDGVVMNTGNKILVAV